MLEGKAKWKLLKSTCREDGKNGLENGKRSEHKSKIKMGTK